MRSESMSQQGEAELWPWCVGTAMIPADPERVPHSDCRGETFTAETLQEPNYAKFPSMVQLPVGNVQGCCWWARKTSLHSEVNLGLSSDWPALCYSIVCTCTSAVEHRHAAGGIGRGCGNVSGN
ncbi:unnamed protein product [Natator depressus]